jgi:hypothetical protein
MKPAPAPTKGKSKKRAAQKARDADVRAELDGGNLSGLRQALKSADKVCGLQVSGHLLVRDKVLTQRFFGQSKPLVEKKQAPAELAKGGDSLAKSMDEVLDLLGAA